MTIVPETAPPVRLKERFETPTTTEDVPLDFRSTVRSLRS